MSERDHQVFVFQVLALNEKEYPFLKYIYAVPNGGHRHPAVAGKLKAEGVKRGVPDICLPFRPKRSHHIGGAYIEMKDGSKRKLTAEQHEFLQFVVTQGYDIKVAHSCDEALDFIEDYCGIKLRGRK